MTTTPRKEAEEIAEKICCKCILPVETQENLALWRKEIAEAIQSRQDEIDRLTKKVEKLQQGILKLNNQVLIPESLLIQQENEIVKMSKQVEKLEAELENENSDICEQRNKAEASMVKSQHENETLKSHNNILKEKVEKLTAESVVYREALKKISDRGRNSSGPDKIRKMCICAEDALDPSESADALLAELKELRADNEKLKKEVVSAVIESRNNYCPCCHARLEEICGPCKWCKDSKSHLDTERSMYQAWRKRAEESEAENTSLREKAEVGERMAEALESLHGSIKFCALLIDNLKYIMCGEHKLADKENKCHLCDAILELQKVQREIKFHALPIPVLTLARKVGYLR